MASVVEIWNQALSKVGAKRVTSIDEQSVAARACRAIYVERRDNLLQKHRWNFAIQRFSLPASATPPAFGPANAYPLPAGYLRLLAPDPRWNRNDRDWVIEGNNILSEEGAPLKIRCVVVIEDPNLMHPTFRAALSADMAAELCEPLTQSNTKKAACATDFKMAIDDAKKANAIEVVPQDAVEDKWLTVRI